MIFFKRKEKKTVLPPVHAAGELDIPPAPPSEEDLPEFPEIPEFKEKPTATAPPKRALPSAEKIEEEAFREEKRQLAMAETHEVAKPVFVRMDSFQSIISELNMIKSIAKESDDAIIRVGDFAEDQDREFNKWQSQLGDIQKKLIFIDKTMFK